MNYYPVKSISEVVEVFTRETNNPAVDSVEGIMFSPDEGVIMAGYFVDKVNGYKSFCFKSEKSVISFSC